MKRLKQTLCIFNLIFWPACATAQAPDAESNAQTSTTQEANQPEISFDEQSKMLTGVYPITLDQMDQVTQNSYNWSGIRDASLACEIGFTPVAIVIRGKVLDDQPFVQPLPFPDKPDWWKLTYGADGLEVVLEDPTSATNRLRFILNYSSAGLNPQVQVLEAPLVREPGILTSSDFKLRGLLPEDIPANIPEKTKPVSGYKFMVALPTSGLAEPRFFSGPLRMTVRLHDLDGPVETYLRMEDVIEKRDQ